MLGADQPQARKLRNEATTRQFATVCTPLDASDNIKCSDRHLSSLRPLELQKQPETNTKHTLGQALSRFFFIRFRNAPSEKKMRRGSPHAPEGAVDYEAAQL